MTAIVAVMVGVVGVLFLFQRRADRRNLAGLCANCRAALPLADAYRLEGDLICAHCAGRMRRRLHVALWALVAQILLTLAAGTLGAVLSLRRGDADWWIGLAVGLGGALFLGGFAAFAVHSMKAMNRDAEQLSQLDLWLDLFKPPYR